MAGTKDVQKEHADAKGKKHLYELNVGENVLLNAKNIPTHAKSVVFQTKLHPRSIKPFTVIARKGLAYTLNRPKKMRSYPVFYVGLLKPYRDPSLVSAEALAPQTCRVRAEPPEQFAADSHGKRRSNKAAAAAFKLRADHAAHRANTQSRPDDEWI